MVTTIFKLGASTTADPAILYIDTSQQIPHTILYSSHPVSTDSIVPLGWVAVTV